MNAGVVTVPGEPGGLTWLAVAAGVALLGANGFFVAAEIALLAARRARIDELAAGGDRRARRAVAALRELPITFSGAQLGITMASLGLGAVAEPAVVRLLERGFGLTPLPAGVHHAFALLVGMSLVVFLHIVVGEMVPKNIALDRAEEISLAVTRPFGMFVWLFRPVITALNALANALVRLTGVEPRGEASLGHTPDEIALLLRESRREGMLPAQEARVLTGALELGDIDAEGAMTPRVDLRALADTAPAREVLELARTTGFTRFPAYHQGLDDVVGLVHVKDVLTAAPDELEGTTVGDLLRPIPAVPESRDLESLLRDMRRDRSHAVLVVDEYGGTAGIVTLEDVLEELVGEIKDEFDPQAREVRQTAARRWVVSGTIRRDELTEHTGCPLENGESETVSGYLTEKIGRLLRKGDQVHTRGWVLRVLTLEGRRAGDVEVVGPPVRGPHSAGGPATADGGP